MWNGQEANTSADPPLEKIVSAEAMLRKADKELNEAYIAFQQAEKAVSRNQDPQAVYDLIQTLRDAQEGVDAKELQLVRRQEYMNLLYADYDMINQAREAVLADKLMKEVEKAAGELTELETVMNTALAAKDAWETEDARLRAARAALDTDTSATDDQKNTADAAISTHQDTKDDIKNTYDAAKTAADEKRNLIKEAERIRNEAEYNEIKTANEAAYYDLEALKDDQLMQVQNFIDEANFWKEERFVALEQDDIELFNEYEKFF